MLVYTSSMGVVRTDERRRFEIEEFRRRSCSAVILKVTTEDDINHRRILEAVVLTL
ncbi:hypothetical protein Hanom_Chr07g00627981 [Helianthus anomalus]